MFAAQVTKLMIYRLLLFITLIAFVVKTSLPPGITTKWNGKKCAVVLTYDDALDVHLDNVIPALDSLNLKGTFYLIGASSVLENRLDEWRIAAKKGHELGNHSLNHACDRSLSNRSWVDPNNDLSKYPLQKLLQEIRVTSTLLKAIDGREKRTFAYPCGDKYAEGKLFYDSLANQFSGARGVNPKLLQMEDIQFRDISSYSQSNSTAEEMISLVREAQKTGSLIVFLFHGVGGGHDLNVKLNEHKKLIEYLHKNQKDIWTAPMVDVAEYVKKEMQINTLR